MSFSSKSAGSSSNSSAPGIHEINITPFVDVVLVLLVIFMVTAPMMMKDVIGLKLPKTKNSDAKSMPTLSIAVTKNGQYLANGELVDSEELAKKAKQMISQNPEAQAVLSADADARHGDVTKAIDIIKTAGIDNFAIQVEKIQQ